MIFHLYLADGMRGGQSLGKRLAKTRVVHAATGEPCTYLQSLGRNVSLWLLGPIDWVFIFGKQRQRLGDMIVKTVVIPAPPHPQHVVAVGEQNTSQVAGT